MFYFLNNRYVKHEVVSFVIFHQKEVASFVGFLTRPLIPLRREWRTWSATSILPIIFPLVCANFASEYDASNLDVTYKRCYQMTSSILMRHQSRLQSSYLGKWRFFSSDLQSQIN